MYDLTRPTRELFVVHLVYQTDVLEPGGMFSCCYTDYGTDSLFHPVS